MNASEKISIYIKKQENFWLKTTPRSVSSFTFLFLSQKFQKTTSIGQTADDHLDVTQL